MRKSFQELIDDIDRLLKIETATNLMGTGTPAALAGYISNQSAALRQFSMDFAETMKAAYCLVHWSQPTLYEGLPEDLWMPVVWDQVVFTSPEFEPGAGGMITAKTTGGVRVMSLMSFEGQDGHVMKTHIHAPESQFDFAQQLTLRGAGKPANMTLIGLLRLNKGESLRIAFANDDPAPLDVTVASFSLLLEHVPALGE